MIALTYAYLVFYVCKKNQKSCIALGSSFAFLLFFFQILFCLSVLFLLNIQCDFWQLTHSLELHI